ncbi:MAG: hypothetical protein JJ863_34330 [Deltaproteobacteria bacterium]|nr:hypothetical protein [Deltaproteobacteria bacterium]
MRKHAFISILGLALAASFAAAQEDSAPSSGLSVTEVVLSKALEDGQPVEPGTSFSAADGRVYATVRVENPSREATTVSVKMRPADRAHGGHGIELEIPARPRYRTVARFTTRRSPGSYVVVVSDSEGNEISTTTLTITE